MTKNINDTNVINFPQQVENCRFTQMTNGDSPQVEKNTPLPQLAIVLPLFVKEPSPLDILSDVRYLIEQEKLTGTTWTPAELEHYSNMINSIWGDE